MFPSTSNSSEHNGYDFNCHENATKWKGLFVSALQKVQRQVHPSLSANEDALQYIESLILQLLGMLCSAQPHSWQDVEQRVEATFPSDIQKWAHADAKMALERGRRKSSLVLPVEKIHLLIIKELLGYKVDYQVSIYIIAVLEYIAADILKLTGNYVKNIKHREITLQDIKVAMCADKVLMNMFFQDDDEAFTLEEPRSDRRGSLKYDEIVKDLILEETQYIRELRMITKVFREPFSQLFPRSKDLEVIFSNISDVYELTVKLLSSLEDTVEVTEQNAVPMVGICFEELIEGAEFEVYEKYADDMLNPNGRERLNTLLQRSDASLTFQSAGHGFKEAVKYVLPKLLLGPVNHCLYYSDVIKMLLDLTVDEEDQECLHSALGMLHKIRVKIEKELNAANVLKRKPGESVLRYHGRAEREAALNKMNQLQKSIDGWEGKNISQSCNKFIMEGVLLKYAGKRLTERYVFLFDGLIILTKQNTKRSSVTGPVGDYRLKEKFNIRKVDVADREDTEEIKNAFELLVRDHPSIIVAARNADEKNHWMAELISLLTRSMLERMLDSKLGEDEKQQPLRLPPPELYRFAEEDSEENIVFEENQDRHVESPLIKGGTLLKLVERLTYHMYADPKFVRTFLTTYRPFCKPDQLLDLLIERFEIPDPPLDDGDVSEDGDGALNMREDLKRYRKEYSKPVQFRVLNVLRHWVDQHWYDFERNRHLIDRLNAFLEQVKGKGKAMRNWVESFHRFIGRQLKSEGIEKQKQITHQNQPPAIEWHIARKPEHFDLITLHPIEIARQVTLLEFDLYCAVRPSEMVGSVWIKKEKEVTSPNLLRMISHSTRFTFWLEKCILEAENFEERVAVVSRILEVMMVFQEVNNFNGVLEVVSALNSAPVYRLEHTLEEVDQKNHKLMKAFDEAKELNSDHYKKYTERLRSINPPCVPFLGMYLTNILLTEEGNPDFLPHRPEGIINFNKRRKVAEITSEIQQYQNQPYCLTPQADIRAYFENLDPLGEMREKDFNDYLYAKSLELEPRNSKQPQKAVRKRDYSLKSPGIKPMNSRHSTATLRGDKGQPTSLASPFTAHRIVEEGDDLASLCGATPPTPSTPLTPPHHDGGNDCSVFATVLIPDTTSNPAATSLASHIARSLPSPLQPVPAPDLPPPLPPRRKRESSLSGELSPGLTQRPDRHTFFRGGGIELRSGSTGCIGGGIEQAPPLPPRRSSEQPLRTPTTQRSSNTLPRLAHHDISADLCINGDDTPELPPKTYRSSQVRKQSS